MKNFLQLLRHDLRLEARQQTAWAALVLFFLIMILLLPFALGPEPALLRRLAPGLVWLAALLMSLLAFDRLFVADARDGTLEVMLLSPLPLPLIVLSRLLAEALMLLMILIPMMIPAALMLGMDAATLPVLAATLLLGVPALALLGGVAGAVTVALRRGPALLTLLLIPFYIPILIFAVAACDISIPGTSVLAPLCLLGAVLAVLLPTAPFVAAAALRYGQE